MIIMQRVVIQMSGYEVYQLPFASTLFIFDNPTSNLVQILYAYIPLPFVLFYFSGNAREITTGYGKLWLIRSYSRERLYLKNAILSAAKLACIVIGQTIIFLICDGTWNALRILLENQGYFIEEAHDGEEGLQKFDSTFDLLIIDIMMPNISGIDVCRKIREKSYVPILFLTAKSLETDKMEALSAGGDDYLVKPFSYVELIARIQALIRRCRVYDNADASDTTASSTIERCGLTLDTKCNNVSYDGRQLALTDKEYQILLLLISHPTKTFSTQNIFESVWNEPYTQFSNNTIMVHIKNLRNKLEAGCGCAHLIKTVWGKGYKFEE